MRRFLNQWTKTFFPTFRRHFEALNATICWSVLCKLLTIEKYGVSAFTGKKLMSSDQNSLRTKEMKFWFFLLFRKKNPFFSNFENPLKKTAPGAVFFFEKLIQLQNCLESLQIIFRTFWRYLWKGLTSHLNDFEALNATISLYARSSHLEAKRSHF